MAAAGHGDGGAGHYQDLGGDGRAAKRSRLNKGGAAGGGGGAADDVGEEGGGGGKKARKRTPKEYVPEVGTANYAFLVTLYISMKEGNEFETKVCSRKSISAIATTVQCCCCSICCLRLWFAMELICSCVMNRLCAL
jgi:hypothetical protein